MSILCDYALIQTMIDVAVSKKEVESIQRDTENVKLISNLQNNIGKLIELVEKISAEGRN